MNAVERYRLRQLAEKLNTACAESQDQFPFDDYEFKELASPANILELLDEIDALQKELRKAKREIPR